MATTNDKIFCDTNIIIRLNVLETPEHAQVKAAVGRLLEDKAELWISRQVVREFCAVLTRPQTFLNPLPSAQVAARVKTLLPMFRVADENAQVADRLLMLMETTPLGGKQVHDANIAATMVVYNIHRLFTLNVADFARFSKLITVLTLEDILKSE
jgi:predicted nucleic acid-binding protein